MNALQQLSSRLTPLVTSDEARISVVDTVFGDRRYQVDMSGSPSNFAVRVASWSLRDGEAMSPH